MDSPRRSRGEAYGASDEIWASSESKPVPTSSEETSMSNSRVVRHLRAPRAAVYRALLDRQALEAWRAPEGMSCAVHEFDPRPGGTFRVSLSYDDLAGVGKSAENTDTYHG